MIPETTLQLARDIIALQARALDEHKMLAAASEQASGAEAVGKAALAAELEQVGKVLANYMPRIMKHVGEIRPLSQDDDVPIPDFLKTPEPPPEVAETLAEHGLSQADSYERVNEVLVKRYAGVMGNSEYARGNASGIHDGKSVVEWLEIAKRVDSGIKWNRGRMAETI